MSDRSRYIARVEFLGAQRIEIGNEVVTPEAERLFAMIVRLSAPLGRITSRQTMMDTLWPGSDEANARHNLRQTVYKAREIGLVVESGEDGLRLDPRHWSCDWEDVEGDVNGEWLIDYEPEFSDDLGAWVTSQRVGVHALIRPRIIRALQRARSAGDLLSADRYAVQLLQIDELNEEATLTRAELMAMQGAKVDALRLLDTYLNEIGRLGAGRDAALPAHLLRRRIAEKLPTASYQNGEKHHGPLVGRVRESKRLIAGLFDARAGRGGAVMLYGREGSGKSRLLYEVKRSAVLQGMRTLEFSVDSTPTAIAFSALRRIVAKLIDLPGALGVSPEALKALRSWQSSNTVTMDECPLYEIEDLLAAIADETALVLLVENCENIDAESITSLDLIYRRGITRHHTALLASAARHVSRHADLTLREIERLALDSLSITEVREIVAAYALHAHPTATIDKINCAAAFAEGIPMYAVEMLGLMLDEGSSDTIPWKVQIAVERGTRELHENHLRLLSLCEHLESAASFPVLALSLGLSEVELQETIDTLERLGYLRCENGVLIVSALMSRAAEAKLRRAVTRGDALRCTRHLLELTQGAIEPRHLYAAARLFLSAREESKAYDLVSSRVGDIVRLDTAHSILFELSRMRDNAETDLLRDLLDSLCEEIRSGSQGKRQLAQGAALTRVTSSLPKLSLAAGEVEYTLSSAQIFNTTLSGAVDPSASPSQQLSEAVMALCIAFNRYDTPGVSEAYQSVCRLRHCVDVQRFDLCRADLIYNSYVGDRSLAIASANSLAEEARIVNNVELACKGFRNAAEALSTFGQIGAAQALLYEARSLAHRLQYHAQVVWTDFHLADLCLIEMDTAGASAHLTSASELSTRKRLHSPLLVSDQNLFECWLALLRDDFSQAQRAARAVVRSCPRADGGTALWTRLGAKLATHRGRRTSEDERDFEILRASIGSTPFYASEHLSTTALLLYTRDTDRHEYISKFAREQFDRVRASGRRIWPFQLTQMQ